MATATAVSAAALDVELARRGVSTAQDGVETSQRGVDTAQRGVDTAQQAVDFYSALVFDSALSKEERDKAEEKLGKAEEKLGKAKEKLGKAKEERDKAKEELGKAKEELGAAAVKGADVKDGPAFDFMFRFECLPHLPRSAFESHFIYFSLCLAADIEGKFEKLRVSSDTNRRAFLDKLKHPKDPHGVLQAFKEHLDACVRLRTERPSTYLANYCVLFQSSGLGKTLLLHRYLGQHYGVYLCLRASTSVANYPPRFDPLANWLLGTRGDYEARFKALTAATVQQFNLWWKSVDDRTPAKWFAHQLCADGDKTKPDFTIFAQLLATSCDGLMDAPSFDVPQLPEELRSSGVTFAVFMDEFGQDIFSSGGETATTFRRARNAWKDLQDGMFVVLADTISKLRNFAGSAYHDPSLRDAPESSPKDLLPPFYLVANMDILAPTPTQLTTRTASAASPSLLFRCGRPLWGGFLDAWARETEPEKKLIKFAKKKLLSGDILGEWEALASAAPYAYADLMGHAQRLRRASLAMLCTRAALAVAPASLLAVELVSGHLGVCLHAFPKRESLLVSYPSEPVVAEAAAQLLATANWLGWVVAIANLHQALQVGEMDAGKNGELVARLLLLLAFDRSRVRAGADFFTGTVSLEAFLVTLFGPDKAELFFAPAGDSTPLYRAAALSFTHFVAVTYTPATEAELKAAWFRGVAFVAKPGQKGYDALLPLRIASPGGSFVYAPLVVQIKNVAERHDSHWPESASSKLLPSFVFTSGSELASRKDVLPCSLYLNLHANENIEEGKNNSCITPLPQQPKILRGSPPVPHLGLCAFTLNLPLFDGLDARIQAQLRKVRDVSRDPVSVVLKDEDRARVVNLLPLVYHE